MIEKFGFLFSRRPGLKYLEVTKELKEVVLVKFYQPLPVLQPRDLFMKKSKILTPYGESYWMLTKKSILSILRLIQRP